MLKIEFIGRLGKDAVVKTMQGGDTVINFNVACSKRWKDAQGTQHEKTTWVQCAYWTKSTAVAQYLNKGTMVYVEGEPEADFYNAGGQDGLTGIQKCKVFKVELLAKPNDNSGTANNGNNQKNNQSNNSNNYPNPNEITEPVDDLPF